MAVRSKERPRVPILPSDHHHLRRSAEFLRESRFISRVIMDDTSCDVPSSSKRPRVDDAIPPISRGSPWFEDGNLVLQAEDVQFRVHRGVLRSNSAIFADMLSISQPDTQATVEGCPVVHLQDNSRELEHLLKALYDRS
jgi:hypothetical protein